MSPSSSSIKRRVVVLGKNALAIEGLRTVLGAGDDVVLALVDPSDDDNDGWQPSFRRFATSERVPMAPIADINDPILVAEIAALRPDFLLSFQAAQLLKAPLLATPAMGALNLHFGPLPRYRGVAPIAWAIINGEAATGVSLHHIHVGVDDGPVISARRVFISPQDTGRAVYDKCTEAGIALFRESWPRIRRRTPPGIPQSQGEVLYYNRYSIDFAQRSVAWRGDCESIANWVRAFIFPPFQYPTITLRALPLEIGSVRWDRQSHRGRPGEILAVVNESIIVAAPGGRVTLGLHDARAARSASHMARLGIVAGAVLS